MQTTTTRKRYGITPEPPQVAYDGRYTVTQTAEKLGYGRRYIYKLIDDGALKPIRSTRHQIRILGREINRYWHSRTA